MFENKWIVLLTFLVALPVSYTNAKSMQQFYGSEKYYGSYDFNDFRRSMSSDSVYDNRVGFKGLAATGRHVNVQIFEMSTEKLVVDKQTPHRHINLISYKDDPVSLESQGACKYYHDFMIDQVNDEEENLKIVIQNMPKWRILKEPHQLRQTRHKIYFNQRAVRILNQRIRKETDNNKINLLKKVKGHFQNKVTLLYELHDHLMAEHDLPWKPRRWVWADFAANNAYCYKGESFNPEIWYEVKKEISRIQKKIESVMEESAAE